MNKHGITLTVLVITIVLIIILMSVGGNVALRLIRNANEQSMIADMLLIQTKVKIIAERVAFNGDTSIYIGTKLKDSADKYDIAGSSLTSSELSKESIYIYDQDTLNSIGLNSIDLEANEVFLVDYSNSDIIYPKGVKREDESIFYRLSQVFSDAQSYTESYIPVVTFETGSDFIEAEAFVKYDVSKYQFVIGASKDEVRTLVGTWQEESTFRFESLESDKRYYVQVKTKDTSGHEKESHVYEVRTVIAQPDIAVE